MAKCVYPTITGGAPRGGGAPILGCFIYFCFYLFFFASGGSKMSHKNGQNGSRKGLFRANLQSNPDFLCSYHFWSSCTVLMHTQTHTTRHTHTRARTPTHLHRATQRAASKPTATRRLQASTLMAASLLCGFPGGTSPPPWQPPHPPFLPRLCLRPSSRPKHHHCDLMAFLYLLLSPSPFTLLRHSDAFPGPPPTTASPPRGELGGALLHKFPPPSLL